MYHSASQVFMCQNLTGSYLINKTQFVTHFLIFLKFSCVCVGIRLLGDNSRASQPEAKFKQARLPKETFKMEFVKK